MSKTERFIELTCTHGLAAACDEVHDSHPRWIGEGFEQICGRGSFLLNCSAYHRLHHARAAEHYGANYAALFPIFDVIAGSYRRAETFVETGLDEAPRTLREALAWPLPEPRGQRVEASPG